MKKTTFASWPQSPRWIGFNRDCGYFRKHAQRGWRWCILDTRPTSQLSLMKEKRRGGAYFALEAPNESASATSFAFNKEEFGQHRGRLGIRRSENRFSRVSRFTRALRRRRVRKQHRHTRAVFVRRKATKRAEYKENNKDGCHSFVAFHLDVWQTHAKVAIRDCDEIVQSPGSGEW